MSIVYNCKKNPKYVYDMCEIAFGWLMNLFVLK